MSLRSSITKLLGAMALVVGMLFFSAGAASASPTPYPPATGPTVVIDSGTLLPGQSITLTFTGFLPNETITVVVFSDPVTLGSFGANGAGASTVSVALPSTLEAGPHTIVGTGGTSGRTASFGFTVPAGLAFTGEGAGAAAPGGSNGGGSGLAFTGIAVGGSLILAVGLLAAGTMTLLAGRRKASIR